MRGRNSADQTAESDGWRSKEKSLPKKLSGKFSQGDQDIRETDKGILIRRYNLASD